MKRLAAIVVAAGLVWGSPGLAAAADGKPNYKNPWKPTKVASEVPDSLYQGKWYVPRLEPFRKCVYARESGANPKAVGLQSGIAQWTQRTWDHYVGLVDPSYVGVRPHMAPPYLQEWVFWRTLNRGKGKHHWSPRHALTIGKVIKGCP
jgi:hypothetical protein